MNALSRWVFALLLLALVGCAAPGSSITRHAVSGTIVDSCGQPLSGQRVEVVLPSSYGLGGLDTYFGKPEDYGHHDQRVTLTTDRQGMFHHVFEPSIYHITFFLLPPFGAFPRQPPKPFYAIHDASGVYFIGYDRDGFDYRIISPSGPLERDASQRVSGQFKLRDYPLSDSSHTVSGWETVVTIRR